MRRSRVRPKIYLAGPMSGCNREQMTQWRKLLKDQWREKCEFIDPTEDLVAPELDPYEVVRRDIKAIEGADGILANMWRESIGTAMGIVVARNKGKPVALADPNRIRNRMAAFYADVIEATPKAALRSLLALLKERAIDFVRKRGGKAPERFSQKKLILSLRKACRAAGRDDLLVPPTVYPRVLEHFKPRGKAGSRCVTTTEIRNAVWEALAELETDPLRSEEVQGIREVWEHHEQRKKGRGARRPPASRDRGGILSRPAEVVFRRAKQHHVIWGTAVHRLSDLPRVPRRVFREICRVPGITQIVFTTSSQGPNLQRCSVEIRASKTAGVIEGKCHDPKGRRGRTQCFQVRVEPKDRTEEVRIGLVRHLGALGFLKHSEEEG